MIRIEIEGSRIDVVLARSDKYNALNVQMISELIEIFEWSASKAAARGGYLRTLVLRGDGKHFCAGADINMMRDAGA